MRFQGLLLALAAPLAAGCVSFQLERNNSLAPIDTRTVATLEPGETTLAQCLARLGAPLWVREHRTHGLELAYGWLKEVDWGLSISVPVTDYTSASMNYDELDRKVRGLVLLFDEELRLTVVREGFLRDIRSRADPAYLDEEAREEASGEASEDA